MKPADVICSAILPGDLERGLEYALRSLHFTYDRMQYGRETTGAYLKRLRNITIGKCAEAALVSFLRSHGVPHNSREGATPHTRPDRFDLRIGRAIVDVKTFVLAEKYATAEFIVNALALVPNDGRNDQWQQRRRYDRYVFAFFAGELQLTLQQELSHLLATNRPPTREEIALTADALRIFITAAPLVAECEKLFRRIRAGTRCVQYPGGTRIDNMGCRIRQLTPFRGVVQWGGV